jgi:hypothetical protein
MIKDLKTKMETDPEFRTKILEKRREYAKSYRERLKQRKAPKVCEKCTKVPVTHKYCKDCARTIRLDRYKNLWANNAEYRDKHRLAAKMSFRRKKAKNVTATC